MLAKVRVNVSSAPTSSVVGDKSVIDAYPPLSLILVLAPLSALTELQRQRVSARLVSAGYDIAENMGFRSVIIFGDPEFYSCLGN